MVQSVVAHASVLMGFMIWESEREKNPMNPKLLIDAMHYGGAGLCIIFGLLAELGVQFPGVQVDGKTAIAAGVGVLAAGWKSGPLAK